MLTGPLTKEFKLPKLPFKPEGKPLPFDELLARIEAYSGRISLPEESALYHTLRHSKRYIQNFEGIVNWLESLGIVVPVQEKQAGVVMGFCHDWLNLVLHRHLPLVEAFRNASPEEIATYHIYSMLLSRDFRATKSFAKLVARGTQATNPHYKATTRFEILAKAADLHDLGSTDYEQFNNDWTRLLEEARTQPGRRGLTEMEFAGGAINYVSLFAQQFLRLSKKAYSPQGTSAWHENALSNLARKWVELHGGRDKVRFIIQVGAGATPLPTERKLEANEFFIGVEPHHARREIGLHASMEAQSSFGSNAPRMFVPGSSARLPIRFKADELHYADVRHDKVLNFEDINKVLAEGGKVVVRETRPGTLKETRGRPAAAAVIARFSKEGFKYAYNQQGRSGEYHLVFKRAPAQIRR